MTHHRYVCPDCGSTNLSVTVMTQARLHQTEDGEFSTEVYDDHEWDHSHTMWCNECGYASCAAEFYVGGKK